jgi:nitrate reductase (NAD(P)H)
MGELVGEEQDKSQQGGELPPTPPESTLEDGESTTSEISDFPLPPPSTAPVEVLAVDKKTPDAHVPRDPRLIRLTGVHPFNVEAPLTALYNEGFLTSPELFYVRNHGAVPEVKDEECLDWEFSVEGCVQHSTFFLLVPKLSLQQNG